MTKSTKKPESIKVVLPDKKQEFCSWLGLERRFDLKNVVFVEHGIFFDKT